MKNTKIFKILFKFTNLYFKREAWFEVFGRLVAVDNEWRLHKVYGVVDRALLAPSCLLDDVGFNLQPPPRGEILDKPVIFDHVV